MTDIKFPKKEEILHFIWMNQYFDKKELKTSSGHIINIIHPGFHNQDAGPDFSESKITINNIGWNGNVEIHIYASEWYQHNHHTDSAYDNVILHVVMKNDKPVYRKDGSLIPVLELENRIDTKLLDNYQNLNNLSEIPCCRQIVHVDKLTVHSMIETAAIERISKKANVVERLMISSINHWETITFRLLLQSFGLNKNKTPFHILGRTIPWKKWNLLSLLQKEAVLFGQASLLDQPEDDYAESLKKEFLFLKYKWNLHSPVEKHHWKFMRMRPSNFPTIRIAQFCAITDKNSEIFQKLINSQNVEELIYILNAKTGMYWENHYHFRKTTKKKNNTLGKEMINQLIINFVVPLLFGYSEYIGDDLYKIKGLKYLENLPSENNKITRLWIHNQVKAESALDSQGLIQLYNGYCSQKLCVNCKIGQRLLSTV